MGLFYHVLHRHCDLVGYMSAKTITKKCPCCGQPMPHTDFQLFKKSAAILCAGYVICPGMVQFRIIEKLWKSYPESVSTSALFDHCYDNTNAHGVSRNVISVHIAQLRRKLNVMPVRIVSQWDIGYALRMVS